MKLEKRITKEKDTDVYVLYISHAEADAAFARMTPLEKGMIRDLQHSEKTSTLLKVLTLWVTRIEESSGMLGEPGGNGGETTYEG